MQLYTAELDRKRKYDMECSIKRQKYDAEAIILIARINRNCGNITKTKKAYLECVDSGGDTGRINFLGKRYDYTMRLGWKLYKKSLRVSDMNRDYISEDLRHEVIKLYLGYENYGIR